MIPPGPRWLRRNERSWSPHRIIVLDAEGTTTEIPGAEVDAFRLAVASFTVRAGDRDAKTRTEERCFHDPAALWAWIAARAHHGHSTWVVAHGLHYDYQVTSAEAHLRALGWERAAWSMRFGARWARWRKGRRTLLLVDLANYLRMPLREIGKYLGIPKLGLPRQAARARTWERYCRRDVAVAREAFLHLLDWWDANDLGRWQLTSAGLASAAFRHRFLVERSIKVHGVAEARVLEREALFGGRREIYRKGRLPEGLWADLDYVSHYCMTAGSVPVPVELGGIHDHVRPDLLDHLDGPIGIIARVEVEVDRPVAPLRDPRRGIVYPVGRFVTTLCQPELELVAAHGRILRWIQVAVYQTAPALEGWAEWVLGALDGARPEKDPLARVLLKDWTRSLIGKFGQRRPDPEPQPGPDGVVVLPELEVSAHAPVPELPWTEGAPPDPLRGEDAPNAVPAITAWVHSAARAWLWRGMEAAGHEALAYCDTDGFLVNVTRHNLAALASLAPQIDPEAATVNKAVPDPLHQRPRPTDASRRTNRRPKVPEVPEARVPPGSMRVKGRYGGVTVHRPADYELDRTELIKGLPRDRERIGDRAYRARYWPGVPWQMVNARPGTYVRPILEVRLGDNYDRGWVTEDGTVKPLEVTVRAGRVVVVPWARTSYARAGAKLADPEQTSRITPRARSPGP